MKPCATCGREFKPSSRHRVCPRCRDKERRSPCPICGKLISRGARTCIKCRPPQPTGPESPRWRGGGKPRQYGPRGYVYAKAPGHPRGARNYGYVFEHILVMEAMLGRYLLPNEQVHHRNGRRDDNRAENLELWVRSQPTGTRVEDAVAWAREILARYTNGPPLSGGGPF